MAEKELSTQRVATYYDTIPMRALALAQTDAAHGKLSHEKQLEVCDTIEEVVDDLSDYEDTASADHTEPQIDVAIIPPQSLTGGWRVDHPVLCVASRSPLDKAACVMLAQLLAKHGLPARVQPFADVSSARSVKIDAPDAPLVCLSYFGSASNPAHVRFLIRRLRRVMPDARFLAGFWMLLGQDEKAEEWRAAVGAHLVATSLSQALQICVDEAKMHVAPARQTATVE